MQQQTISQLPQHQYTEAATAEILHLSYIAAAANILNVLLREHDERLLLSFWSKMWLFYPFFSHWVKVQFLACNLWKRGISTKTLNLHHFSLFRPVYGYQQVPSVVTLCCIRAAEVSWDVYCERVNRLCCCFRGHGLRHINPLLYVWADQVTGANGSKITWLSVQHIRLIIMFCFFLIMFWEPL